MVGDTGYTPSPSMYFDHFLAYTYLKDNKPSRPSPLFISKAACTSKELRHTAMLSIINFITEHSLTEPAPTFSALAFRMNTIYNQLEGISDFLASEHDSMLVVTKAHLTELFKNYFSQIVLEADFLQPSLSISNIQALESVLNNLKTEASNLSRRLRKRKYMALETVNKKIKEFKISPNNRHELDVLEQKQQAAISQLLGYSKNKDTLVNILSSCDKAANISRALNRKFSTPTSVIRDENGQPFMSDQDRADHVVNFYKSIYSQAPANIMSLEEGLDPATMASIPKLSQQHCDTLTAPITNKEITDIIKSLGSGKAPGLDGIPNDLLKNTADLYINLINHSFNDVLSGHSVFPSHFKSAKIVLIPKKSNPKSVKNWRPISLGSSLYKIYSKVLAKRISKVLPAIIGTEQKAYTSIFNISETTANLIDYIDTLLNAEKKPQ